MSVCDYDERRSYVEDEARRSEVAEHGARPVRPDRVGPCEPGGELFEGGLGI